MARGARKTLNAQDILERADKGRFFEKLTEDVQKVAAAVNLSGKPGEVTVKIKITSEAHGQLLIFTETSDKTPKPKTIDSLYFVEDETGELSREDPKQAELPFTPRLADGDGE